MVASSYPAVEIFIYPETLMAANAGDKENEFNRIFTVYALV